MRIFQVVQDNDERLLALLSCSFKNVFHLAVFIRANICRHTLMCLSRLVEEHPEITEVDINPLMLYGDGRPATAVDAMVVMKK